MVFVAICKLTYNVTNVPNSQVKTWSDITCLIYAIFRIFVDICDIGRHQFRAKPVNPEIFTNPTLGIKKVVPRECTVAAEFHLEIEERLKQRHTNDADDQSEQFEFHARPVPKAILEGPVVSTACSCMCVLLFLDCGLNDEKGIWLTVPENFLEWTFRVFLA